MQVHGAQKAKLHAQDESRGRRRLVRLPRSLQLVRFRRAHRQDGTPTTPAPRAQRLLPPISIYSEQISLGKTDARSLLGQPRADPMPSHGAGHGAAKVDPCACMHSPAACRRSRTCTSAPYLSLPPDASRQRSRYSQPPLPRACPTQPCQCEGESANRYFFWPLGTRSTPMRNRVRQLEEV